MNVLYTDGHGQYWHWLCPKTMTGLGAQAAEDTTRFAGFTTIASGDGQLAVSGFN